MSHERKYGGTEKIDGAREGDGGGGGLGGREVEGATNVEGEHHDVTWGLGKTRRLIPSDCRNGGVPGLSLDEAQVLEGHYNGGRTA